MKKFRTSGIVIAAVLAVVIGGVYATWIYAEGAVTGATDTKTSIGIEGIGDDTPKGTITVDTNNLKITIDDSGNDHIANNVVEDIKVEGSATVKYTPNATNGTISTIKMKWTLSDIGVINFGDNKTATITINTAEQTVNNGQECAEFTISADMVKSLITAVDVQLPTKADYEAFKTAIAEKHITLTVSEVI